MAVKSISQVVVKQASQPSPKLLILTIMVTNRELLLNMVKRINKKTNRNFGLHFTKKFYYLEDDNKQVSLDKTPRTALQMFEFLAGFEVAIDNLLEQKE